MEFQSRRREDFAQNLAIGMAQYKAYLAAGYEGARSNASSLARDPAMKSRVAEIQKENRKSGHEAEDDNPHELHSELWFCRELARLMDLAIKQQDYKMALACVRDVCAIRGLGAENKPISTPRDNHSNHDALPPPSTINLSVLIDANNGGDNLPDILRDDARLVSS